MPKKLPKVGKKKQTLKTSIFHPTNTNVDKNSVNIDFEEKPKKNAFLPANNISVFLEKFTASLKALPAVKNKEHADFLETLPGKIRQRKGKKSEPRAKKERPKREKKPKKKAERKSRPVVTRPVARVARQTYPKFLTTSITKDLGISNAFAKRRNLDPRFSTKDTRLEMIGKNGGVFVKQDAARYTYPDWNAALSHQRSEWNHVIWLDPSGPATMILPAHQMLVKEAKIVKGRCPTKLNLQQQFGKDVEFIYMSPPWDSPNFGYSKRGYFTVDLLEKIKIDQVQRKGFVFIWIPFHLMPKIRKIMHTKGYSFVDSCGAMLSDFSGEISTEQRNPNAKKNSSNHEDYVGRMSGTCVKGTLWKKTEGPAGKERFRIGNQIMYDVFQWRRKKDQFTGQLLPDHGYAYQLYHYLMVQKPEKAGVIHALHLWCRPGMRVKNFGGVEYFPEYDYKLECLKSEAKKA